jgi:hypothetical protein
VEALRAKACGRVLHFYAPVAKVVVFRQVFLTELVAVGINRSPSNIE